MVGADIFIFSKICAPMTQTNQPGKKPNEALKEDSLEEIISWGSPVATISDASQEEMFSCNKTLDFLDEDEDTSINESFCGKTEIGKERISNGYISRLDLGDEDQNMQESLDKEKELGPSKDFCGRHHNEGNGCSSQETAAPCHRAESDLNHSPEYKSSNVNCDGNSAFLKDILGDEESSEDLFGKKELSKQFFSENSDGRSSFFIKDDNNNVVHVTEESNDLDGEEQKLAPHEPEHALDGTKHESCSRESPSLAEDTAFMHPHTNSSSVALATNLPGSEDVHHSNGLDTVSRLFNTRLRCHGNAENADSHLSSHGTGNMHKSSVSSASGKFKFHHPVIKSCGESLLVYIRVSTRRCSNGKVIERSVATLQLHRPIIPTISEDSFRDKTVFRILFIKNLVDDRSKISSLLNIKEKDIFDSDINVVVDKDFLNDAIMRDRKILNSAESIFEFIQCSNENSKNILKFKMGLDSSKNLVFEPGNLYQIVSSGDKQLARPFILSQKNIMLFFVLFYKLGLAKFEDYRGIFCNNIYHQYILSRLGIWKNSTMRQSKNGWSIMSVVDFGISKILSIDQEQHKEGSSVLDGLISERTVPEKSTSDGDGLKIGSPTISGSLEYGNVQRPVPNDGSSSGVGLSSRNDPSEQEDSYFVNGEVSATSTTDNVTNSGTQDSLSGITDGYAPKGALALFDDSDEDFEIFGSPSREDSSKSIQEAAKSNLGDEYQRSDALHAESTAENAQPTESAEAARSISGTSGNTEVSLPADYTGGEDGAAPGPTSSQDVPGTSDDKPRPESMIYKTSLGSKSSSDLEQENPAYKKKFSKSFADIFMLEGNEAVANNLDVSSYVPKTEECDKPLMQSCDGSDSSKTSVISSLFGFFKKKQSEPSSHKDDPYMNRFNMPLKAEIRVPEKERKVVHSFYANKKQAKDLEIPGFRQSKR